MTLDYIHAENSKTAKKTHAFKHNNFFSAGPGFSTPQSEKIKGAPVNG